MYELLTHIAAHVKQEPIPQTHYQYRSSKPRSNKHYIDHLFSLRLERTRIVFPFPSKPHPSWNKLLGGEYRNPSFLLPLLWDFTCSSKPGKPQLPFQLFIELQIAEHLLLVFLMTWICAGWRRRINQPCPINRKQGDTESFLWGNELLLETMPFQSIVCFLAAMIKTRSLRK